MSRLGDRKENRSLSVFLGTGMAWRARVPGGSARLGTEEREPAKLLALNKLEEQGFKPEIPGEKKEKGKKNPKTLKN